MISLILTIIIILVAIVILLMAYNIAIHKKIDSFHNLNEKIVGLNILQDFMDTLSECTTVEEKFNKINDILLQRYQIKYSTIVAYNGAEYVIKASNVDQKHWDSLKNLQNEPTFQESIQTATPKYLTVENENERLPYQKMEFARAKSAIFFPLYIENIYIGYWLIEGSNPHEFDTIDTTLLEVVRNNIVSVLKTVTNQSIIENLVRDDKFSSLKTAEYLYGEGRKTIDQYTTSTICLFKIINLEEINDTISRKTGDKVITEVCNIVRNDLAKEYLFVRYMGPKFAIVFPGVDNKAVGSFMETIKKQIESAQIEPVNIEFDDEEIVAEPKINVAISTYYKGTALEEALAKLEEYLDNADNQESVINYL